MMMLSSHYDQVCDCDECIGRINQLCLGMQATMARKLRDSDIATQWTLNYQLNNKLRMQFNISSSSPYPRTLVFQYSGEGGPRS